MKDKVTIVYYTSNQEDEKFEQKIRDNIRANCNGIPIISVSHKPINFGSNICVGVHDVCNANLIRQIQIGVLGANTDYILAAEADCLYPPEYFMFVPDDREHCYRYSNLWILYKWVGKTTKGLYWRKKYLDGAQIASKKLWLEAIDKSLYGRNMWSSKDEPNPPRRFTTGIEYSWGSDNPVIEVKTGHGLRSVTGTMDVEPVDTLPYWGSSKDLRRKLFED